MIRFYCHFESGVIVDTELDDDEDSDECFAPDNVNESTCSSAESSSEQSSKYECDAAIKIFSTITSVSSAFSDSTEDASISETEEDDFCVNIDFASSETQCIASAEKKQAPTSPISTATEGSHTTPTCLDIVSSTEITEDTSTSMADHESVPEGLVFDDDTKAVAISFSSPTEEAPVTTPPSPAALLTSESGDDNQTKQLVEEVGVVPEDLEPSIETASSVSVTFEDDITHTFLPSTVNVEHAAYIPPAHCTEDTPTAHGDSLSSLIETAGFPQDLDLIQPPPTNSLVWDTVCTAGFALSSVPWLRIGVATAGIVVDVAATLLRG